eukprot:33187-Eustigmatos_ZCMA.PRE.1
MYGATLSSGASPRGSAIIMMVSWGVGLLAGSKPREQESGCVCQTLDGLLLLYACVLNDPLARITPDL